MLNINDDYVYSEERYSEFNEMQWGDKIYDIDYIFNIIHKYKTDNNIDLNDFIELYFLMDLIEFNGKSGDSVFIIGGTVYNNSRKNRAYCMACDKQYVIRIILLNKNYKDYSCYIVYIDLRLYNLMIEYNIVYVDDDDYKFCHEFRFTKKVFDENTIIQLKLEYLTEI